MFIGSSFVGDHTRHRLGRPGGSTPGSTPPASPPPDAPPSASAIMQAFPAELYSPPQNPQQSSSTTDANANSLSTMPPLPQLPPPKPLDPAQALELRLRWLEAILFGVRGSRDGKGKYVEKAGAGGETLVRSAGELQKRMDEIIQAHDSLRRFVDNCECVFATRKRFEKSLTRCTVWWLIQISSMGTCSRLVSHSAAPCQRRQHMRA